MSTNLPRYKSKASRFEYCCVRGFYMCPLALIGGLSMIGVAFIISLFNIVNFITILFTGQRNKTHYEWVMKRSKWSAHIFMYMSGATDERPSLTPC